MNTAYIEQTEHEVTQTNIKLCHFCIWRIPVYDVEDDDDDERLLLVLFSVSTAEASSNKQNGNGKKRELATHKTMQDELQTF